MQKKSEKPTMSPLPTAPAVSPPGESFYQRGEHARRWGALLLLVGVVWLVFSLTTRGTFFGLNLGLVEATQPLAAQVYTAERVVLRGVHDQVELVGHSDNGIIVEGVEHGFGWNSQAAAAALEGLEVVIEEHDEVLSIEVRRPPSFGSFIGQAPYARIRIALPAGVAAEVNLVSGDLQATGTQGDLQLTSVSGDVQVAESNGRLTLTNTSGELVVRNQAGPLVIETVSGDVTVVGAETLRISTVSGDVALEAVRGALELHTISGDLRLAAAREAVLNIDSTSGDVQVEAALAPASASTISSISGDLRLRLIDPRDLRVEVSSASGDIQVNLDDRQQPEGGHRQITTLGAGTTSLRLNSATGDIEVAAQQR